MSTHQAAPSSESSRGGGVGGAEHTHLFPIILRTHLLPVMTEGGKTTKKQKCSGLPAGGSEKGSSSWEMALKKGAKR